MVLVIIGYQETKSKDLKKSDNQVVFDVNGVLSKRFCAYGF
ncbi:hypothetical protein U3A58_21575 [Algoriphagus sp. C2-6-M1]|nr:hypothetical protein [Algoriphagus sp. C2-6-M1]MEB2782979.1 hypothetical protein [Algoriphagus sp. C2-6-M1]